MTRDFTERETAEGNERGERDAEADGDGTSRRALLGATAAVATTGALGSLGAAKQRESRTNDEGRPNQQSGGAARAKRAFRFGGREQGWYGRAPESIENESVAGIANPTLRLEPGAVYEVTWENLDGEPHNFAFRDADENFLPVILPEGADLGATTVGNATGTTTEGTATETTAEGTTTTGGVGLPENGIEQTEIIREQGDDQTFYFVAVEEIADYLCVIHPELMVGQVTVGGSTTQTTGTGGETTTGSE